MPARLQKTVDGSPPEAAGQEAAIGASGTATGNCALLDRAHLGVQTMGMADLQAEVLQMFIELAPAYIAAIAAASEPPILQAAAHTLKGASLGIGAFRLGQLADQLEQQAAGRGGPIDPDSNGLGLAAAPSAVTEQLLQTYEATRIEIDALLDAL